MDKIERKQLISLIKKEVIPAIGCTEPIAVALCTAKSVETLGMQPTEIQVYLSANVLKNAMGVGIPGTGGMIGLPIAIALGAISGNSSYQLEVLKEVTPEAVEKGKQMINDKRIHIALKEDTEETLYIEVCARAGEEEAIAVIAGGHTRFTYVERSGKVLLDEQTGGRQNEGDAEPELSLRKVYDFAMQAPLDEISFITESSRINREAAELSFKGDYGHGLGKTLNSASKYQLAGDSPFTSILSYTSAACDARMAGAMIPVMSNSGSGNQGIAATLPVTIFAEKNNCSQEELIRALILSHLTVIYIKQSLGRLSALCGCVVAATGSSCGIVHLMGGSFEQVSFAVKNMIANLTGMICDGAKPSCSMKVSSGVSTALFSAMMAMEQKCVTSAEGIIEDDVDKCIRNLTYIGSQGMKETDKIILEIMTHKG